ncbi:hypothetical protein N7535_009435 [Penicillium sp. DV-2018c]|nr:hypothetical protein N7535_009435 [Penicillium sp. DV-2018c]
MTQQEAIDARATTAIFPREGEGCKVAPNEVTTGFLETGYFMSYYNPETEEEIKQCTDTMKNFFTYLLYHDVCPAHKDDLEEARKTCDRSTKELLSIQQLIHHDGPGDFNHGCSKLFVDDETAWKLVRFADTELFTSEMARKIVEFGIALAKDDRDC